MIMRFAATEDLVTPGRRLALLPAARVVYLRRGRLTAWGADDVKRDLAEDSCALFVGPLAVEGDGEVWGFELYGPDADEDPARVILAVDLPLDPDAPVLLRADRVDFPAGAVTPRHGHAGPGIRRLLFGCLSAEVDRTLRRIQVGEAWFETGHDPVIGRN